MRTTFRSHKRSATMGAALTAVLALALTACNGDELASGNTQASPASSADEAGGDTGNGSTGNGDTGNGGTGNGGTSEGTADMCRSGVLDATAANNTTDETNGVVTVTFKNVGSADCRISGFPGVDIKTSLGDTVSVARNSESAVPQVLKEGDTAAFNITYPVNNTGGSGVRLTDMVVTPPNEVEPFTLKWPAGTLPVTDGQDGRKMEVSPVGKASDSPAG